MNQIKANLSSTDQIPVSKKWLKANDINVECSTILNYTDVNDTNLLQSNFILIDESKTEINHGANELFLIERCDQQFLSWVNVHELGYLELRGLYDGSENSDTVILPEIIDKKSFAKEIKVIGKAFPIAKNDNSRH